MRTEFNTIYFLMTIISFGVCTAKAVNSFEKNDSEYDTELGSLLKSQNDGFQRLQEMKTDLEEMERRMEVQFQRVEEMEKSVKPMVKSRKIKLRIKKR